MARIYVVGIGFRPFDSRTSGLVRASSVILASKRLFDVFRRYEEFEAVREWITVLDSVDETFSFIRAMILTPQQESGPLVLLAAGDPLFHGIGRRAVDEFGKDEVEILPDLSSIQVAFARIREPWDQAFLVSLHGGPDPGKRRESTYNPRDIPSLLVGRESLGILTDRENNPAVIAGTIAGSAEYRGLDRGSLKMYVCERLGYPDERIHEGDPEDLAGLSFSEPNIVILIRRG